MIAVLKLLFAPTLKTYDAPPVERDRSLKPGADLLGKPLTTADEKKMRELPPSFADFLRFSDWDADTGAFILSDGRSIGYMWELTPVATEGRDHDTLVQMHSAQTKAVRTALTEDTRSPWITQFFVQDEASLYPFWTQLNENIPPALRDTQLAKHWLGEVDAHLQDVAKPGGAFEVDGKPWRGKERRVFVTLYRNATRSEKLADNLKRGTEVRGMFTSAFESNGVKLRACRGRDLVEWMQPFLNPTPSITDGDPYALLRLSHFPDEINRKVPLDWDLAEYTLRSAPRQVTDGVWQFHETFYTTLTVQMWSGTLAFGLLTGEDKNAGTLMDQLPEGTRIAIAVIGEPQFQIENHLAALIRVAVGDGKHVFNTHREVDEARQKMADGEKYYRVSVVFYLSAKTTEELSSKANRCGALLTKQSLPVFEERYDLFRGTAFVDNMPFGFSYERDMAGPRRATLQEDGEIAKLLPTSGRSRGTGTPMLAYFNRGAEPLTFDPLKNRIRNAHMTVFGPTGSGKSAALTYAMLQLMTVHKPYLWIIDPKWPAPSFGLLITYFRAQGLSVNHVQLTNDSDVALNPFDQAMQLLDPTVARTELDEADVEGGRDLLGEMISLAIQMITGGEEEEVKNMRRADRTAIATAIMTAAQAVKARGGEVVLTEDVAAALAFASENETVDEKSRARCYEMGSALLFFTQGTAGRIFNRPGKPWPTVDVTLVEFATLGTEGYSDQLAVAFMSLLQAIQLHITRQQYGHRNTVVVVDEVHSLASNHKMGAYIAKIIKTWRSAGAWYWQATQSIDDFKGSMSSLLTQLEWMLLLSMPKDDITKLRTLKNMTDEQAAMVGSATKAPGLFTEGVVLHETCTALFRAVFPPLALALAQTEQNERAARRDIQIATGCDELASVYEVARRIGAKRASHANAAPAKTWSDRK